MDGRDMRRVREVALQRIIEATAVSRIRRALRSHTTTPGELHDYSPGGLVDFWRPTAKKDLSGWHGPARVIQNVPERGHVKLHWLGKEILCEYAQVRRFMDFTGLVYISRRSDSSLTQALQAIKDYAVTLGDGKMATIGYVSKQVTKETKQKPQVMHAVDFLAENLFRVEHAYAARIGKGLKRLPQDLQATNSIVITWEHDPSENTVHELEGAPNITTNELVGSEWQKYTYMQLLLATKPSHTLKELVEKESQEYGSEQSPRPALSRNPDDERLSTIPEEGSDDLDQEDVQELLALLASLPEQPHSSEVRCMQSHSSEVRRIGRINDVLEPALLPEFSDHANIYTQYLTEPAPEPPCGHMDHDEAGYAYVAMEFPGDSYKLLTDKAPPQGSTVTLRVYAAGVKQAVVERDSEVLTKEEFQANKAQVAHALREELLTWTHHKCFTRRPRRGARNILDVRWVGRWKWVKSPKDPTKKDRIIRMRMTLR
jgi:hypothetical protein